MFHPFTSSMAGLALVAGTLLGEAPPQPAAPPQPIKIQAQPGGAPQPIKIQAPGAQPAATAVAPSNEPAGTMEIPETIKDFGSVERGTELKHAFVVKNTGKFPLRIDAKAG